MYHPGEKRLIGYVLARGDDQGSTGKEPKTRYRGVEKIDGYLLEGTRRRRHGIPDDAAARLKAVVAGSRALSSFARTW
jgi:hypothetical protein